ncbi:GGDEF domain-containing protein [Streptomyces ipomoeae]|jgi:diguanylate cyclase (GGDEF)-like protein|uniref:GGDEF domain-containing protein n=1 Tax=Streptomyces ipomoeae TaxID=103232 RepID=UPI001147604D|nr:GGDEF domain-containing protein [Streptomyces ipomoeae]MDX2828765.1 GGDEF domain-containing protein [Streptomyces ipomoeae]MDX2881057.1 GGDEF domain-containing protein [Streptomyces ipomoeae]TQE38129.1 GGDEF domain-containing protein [Streptomyces ipomoeae]
MSELLFAAAAGLPLAAGWSVHAVRLTRRIEAARRDPLTGLWTRDAFERRAGRLLARHPHVVVVLVDLDGFKTINDTHGHAAGDAAICATGASLNDALAGSRRTAAGRLGGDEFAAAVTLSDPAALPRLLRGLHDEITAPFRHAGRDLTVGASIGAVLSSEVPAGTGRELPALLRMADEAMYTAKRGGGGWRNAAFAPRCTTTAGRRTGRPGTHTTQQRGAA